MQNIINKDWQKVFQYLNSSAQNFGYSSFDDFIYLNFDSRVAKEKMAAKIMNYAEELQKTAFEIEIKNFQAAVVKREKKLRKESVLLIVFVCLLALISFLIVNC